MHLHQLIFLLLLWSICATLLIFHTPALLKKDVKLTEGFD